MKKNSRIQLWRALSIIAVVFIHTCPGGLAGVFIRPFLNFCVASFVFLSGYLTKADKKTYGSFFKKRIFKVLIPYIVWSVAYTVLQGDYSNLFTHLIKGSACVPFYYIFVYIQLVLLTPLCIKLLNTRHWWWGLSVTPISLVVTRYIFPLNHITLPFIVSAGLFSQWFTFYYLGMVLGNKKTAIKLSAFQTISLFALALMCSLTEGYLWYRYGNTDMATSQLRFASLFVSIMVCVLIDRHVQTSTGKQRKCHALLCIIGDCSFGIYLIHIMMIEFIAKIPFINILMFPLDSIVVVLLSTTVVFIGRKLLGDRISGYLGF